MVLTKIVAKSDLSLIVQMVFGRTAGTLLQPAQNVEGINDNLFVNLDETAAIYL
jgi:hypothetical protein